MAGTNYQQIITSQPWVSGSSAMASFFQFGNSDDRIRDLGLHWNVSYTFDTTLMSYLAGKPITTSDPQGKFIVPMRNREEITGTSAGTPTASGSNLIVTLTGSPQSNFRNGDSVFDNLSKVSGRVVAGGLTNVLTIEPYTGTTFSTSTNFQGGSSITRLNNVSAINTSTGVPSLYQGFNEYSDYCLTQRDNVQYNRSDKLTVMFTAPDGAQYFYNQATLDCMNRINKDRAVATIYGTSTLQTSSYQGQVAGYRGMRQAAIAEGYPIQQSSVLLQSQFEDLIYYVADNQPMQNQKLTYMGARQMLGTIQGFYPTQLVQPPALTEKPDGMLGALAYSNNVQTVKFGGIEANWIYSAVLQDATLFPQQTSIGRPGTISQNTLYVFTSPMIPSINPAEGSSQCITRFVPTWSTGELEVSTQPGAFSKIIKAADGSYLCSTDTTGWTEYYGRTEGFHFQGQLFGIYEPTV